MPASCYKAAATVQFMQIGGTWGKCKVKSIASRCGAGNLYNVPVHAQWG